VNCKKKYLVVDVETANTLDTPFVYDIGLAVTDNTGFIYEKHSFLIQEVFQGMPDLMATCYFYNKLSEYYMLLAKGKTQIKPFLIVRRFIHELIDKYNINTVCAYNACYDCKALDTTIRYLTNSKYKWFFPFGIEVNCIWNMACQVIYSQRQFVQWAMQNGYVSSKNNVMTNAEVGTKYLTQDVDFTEQHRGLDDVLIECAIMAHCFKKHKKMDRGINRNCWQIPNKVYKKMFVQNAQK